jgi:hypothetical protein
LSVGQDGCVVPFEAAQHEVPDALSVNVFLGGGLLEDSVEFEASLIADDDLMFGWGLHAVAIMTNKFPRNHGSDPDGHFYSVFGVAFVWGVGLDFHARFELNIMSQNTILVRSLWMPTFPAN